MADFEVHIDLDGRTRQIGLARSNRVRGTETVIFWYDGDWLDNPDRFSLEPALSLGRGDFAPPTGLATFGSIGDSAPDTWGRRLMQRAERRLAEREGRVVRTLLESDYLLGVADETRLGALRFRRAGDNTFQAPIRAGVPALIELGRLLQITERILRDEETDEDLQFIFAPGSSLGGARPKASVIDRHGHLSIAKFPKETDAYSMETWEEIALRLASQAGIATPPHDLIDVAGKKVLLSRRFDRQGAVRIPFLSAMAMMGARDGERGSYPEIVDVLAEHGARGKTDAHALYRARRLQRVDLQCRRSPVQPRFPVARKDRMVTLSRLRPQSRTHGPRGARPVDQHRSRRGHLFARSAGGRRRALRVDACAGSLGHQGSRERNLDLARHRRERSACARPKSTAWPVPSSTTT